MGMRKASGSPDAEARSRSNQPESGPRRCCAGFYTAQDTYKLVYDDKVASRGHLHVPAA